MLKKKKFKMLKMNIFGENICGNMVKDEQFYIQRIYYI